MNPGRFYMPRMGNSLSPVMRANFLPSRGSMGLFGRISSSLRSFNWSGLLNGANKTLNVVNQTIPLVRQAGPMLNNMKSMLRLAKVFGSETNRNNSNVRNNNRLINNNISTSTNEANNSNMENLIQETKTSNDNYPSFFV